MLRKGRAQSPAFPMDIFCRLGSVGRPDSAHELQELMGKNSMGCMRTSERLGVSSAMASFPGACKAEGCSDPLSFAEVQ